MTALDNRAREKNLKIELLVIFAVLISLGFPGSLTELYGNRLGTFLEYAAFLIEISAMLLSSGNNWLDIQLVNLDKKYLALYLFVAVLFVESMLVTRYPSLQVVTCARLAVTAFFVIWMQEYFSFERLIELICIAQVLFLAAVLYMMLLHPVLAFESGTTYHNALRGIYSTKNSFAAELVFGILVMVSLIREKRARRQNANFWFICLVMQVILLFLCQATGPVFCLMLAMSLLLVPSHIRMPLGWLYIAGNIGFLFAMLTLMPAFEWIFEAIGKDATLTGRIPLWNQIIEVMVDHNTFTGFGYGMFWRDSQAYALIHAGFDKNSFFGTMTTGGHNVLMDFWLNSGLVGITALFGSLLYSMRNIHRLAQNKYIFVCLIMVYLMVNGLTEKCLGGNYDYKTLSFLLVLAICSSGGEESAVQRE